MIKSFKTERFPYLPIHIQIGVSNKIELDIETLVDTGFGGGISIPKDLVDLSNLPFMETSWVLADGTEIITPTYLAYVQIAKFDPVLTTIITLGDKPLVGRNLINHFKIIFDHGKKLILKP